MLKGVFSVFAWMFQILMSIVIDLWRAHVNVAKNLILPRRVVFPTLKDENKHTTGRS